MKKLATILLIIMMTFTFVPSNAYAENTATHGEVSGRTVIAGLTSLIIWPGIGQAINENQGKKILTHVVAGLIPPFRLWSGWDAIIDRQGGRWDGKL